MQGHGAAAETIDAPEGTYPFAPVVRALRVCLSLGVRPTDADVVHSHTWYAALRRSPGPAHPRHPAGRDRPLDRAAPAVEARAARPGRRRLGVGRARRPRGRRRGHRRLDGDAAGPPPPLRDRARAGARHPERRRHRHLPPGARPDAHRAVRDRPGAPLRALRGADLPAEGSPPPDPRHPRASAPRSQVVLCAGAPDTPEIAREVEAAVARRPGGAVGGRVDPRDGGPGHGRGALLARGGLLLPVGLRAVRPDQPRGDGLRDPGGRDRGRRHPGGRRRRRDRPARPRRSGRARRRRRAAGSRGLRARSGAALNAPPRGSRAAPDDGRQGTRSGPRPSSAGRPWPAARSRSTALSRRDSVEAR